MAIALMKNMNVGGYLTSIETKAEKFAKDLHDDW